MCDCIMYARVGEMVLSNEKAIQMSPLQLHCINKRMTLPLASSGMYLALPTSASLSPGPTHQRQP